MNISLKIFKAIKEHRMHFKNVYGGNALKKQILYDWAINLKIKLKINFKCQIMFKHFILFDK